LGVARDGGLIAAKKLRRFELTLCLMIAVTPNVVERLRCIGIELQLDAHAERYTSRVLEHRAALATFEEVTRT
jgi:hypothetical protein